MKRLILSILLAITTIVCFSVPAFALTTADVTITATPEYLALTVSDGGTNTWAIGAVAESTTKWYTHDNAAPDEPVGAAEGKVTVTNTGSIASNVKLHGHNFTGGVGWTIAGTTGSNQVVLGAGKEGDANKAAMLILTASDQEYIHNLAASGTSDGVLYLDTGTFTDGAAKSTTITYTIEKHT